MWEADTICPAQACKLTLSLYLFARWHLFWHVGYLRHQQQVDLLTVIVVSESRVTWATSVPILVFLGLSVLNLGPMYVRDVRQHYRLMPPPMGRDITKCYSCGYVGSSCPHDWPVIKCLSVHEVQRPCLTFIDINVL